MGRQHFWFTVIPLEPAEEGTDRWAVENGYVSLTPLRLNLTDEQRLTKMLQTANPAEKARSR
jgi:5'-nucleotidase